MTAMARRLWLIGILALWGPVGLLSAPAACSAEAPIDFVVDLDLTLFEHGTTLDPIRNDEPGAILDGDRFVQLHPGAEEFIASLLRIPQARVSFFSASPGPRVEAVLRQIRLPGSDRTALDIAYKVLSFKDLTATGPDALARERPESDQVRIDPAVHSTLREFRGPLKKDLRLVNPDTSNVFLIDDAAHYAAAGQEKNLIRVSALGERRVDLNEKLREFPGNFKADPGRAVESVKKEGDRFFFFKNQFARVRGLIETALRQHRETGEPMRDVLWKVQFTDQGGYRLATRVEKLAHVRAGLRLLKETNPRFVSTVPYPPTKDSPCLLEAYRQIRP